MERASSVYVCLGELGFIYLGVPSPLFLSANYDDVDFFSCVWQELLGGGLACWPFRGAG